MVHLFCQRDTKLIDKKDAGPLDRTKVRPKGVFEAKITV